MYDALFICQDSLNNISLRTTELSSGNLARVIEVLCCYAHNIFTLEGRKNVLLL